MPRRVFLFGLLTGILTFLVANILAAHLRSDCGLAAVLGRDYCADDIVRVGFPLKFFEEGGFAYRHNFNQLYLYLDIFMGLTFAVICGFATRWFAAWHWQKS